MKSRLLVLSLCLLVAACADIQETGISRSQAIAIAKKACPEYPEPFGFMDRAEWISEKGFWVVVLDDQSARHGRVYKIDRTGTIVGTRDINEKQPLIYNAGPAYPPYYDPWPYYYGGPPVVIGVYGHPGYYGHPYYHPYHHW